MVPQEEQKHPTARKRRRIWAAFAAVAVVVLSAAVLQGSGPSADLAVAPAGATSQPATPEATSAATAPKATVAPARPKAAQPKATPDGNSSASPPQTSTKPAAPAASSAIPASAIENPQLAQASSPRSVKSPLLPSSPQLPVHRGPQHQPLTSHRWPSEQLWVPSKLRPRNSPRTAGNSQGPSRW